MKIGIFGFGAVGSALYNEIKEYKDLYILVDSSRYKRYKENEFKINGDVINPKFITSGNMDIIFISLKNYELENSILGIKPFLGKNTIIIPLLNGILAHDIIKSYFPYNKVCYGVINVESNKIGYETICGKILNMQYGFEFNYPIKKELIDLKRILDKYKVNNNIYGDMKRRVWLKWMLNLGINQISALLNATYKDMSDPLIQDLFIDIFTEVYKVALAYNINLTYDDVLGQMVYCKRFESSRVTSLTIDFNKKGKNELDTFGKTLVLLADKKGIDVPINKTLYALLKLKNDKNMA